MEYNTWVGIPGYEMEYEINIMGDVRSRDRYILAEGRKVAYLMRGMLMKQTIAGGYWSVEFSRNNLRKRMTIHRLLAIIFISNPENKPEVNHKDGDKLNNDINNLEWCTSSENAIHAHANGLIPPSKIGPGEMSPAAKLRDKDILHIRKLLQKGRTQSFVAGLYGVSKGNIGFIAKRQTWAHM